jgi:dTDP-4-dehydrorhamnose 3,5-epimerase
MLTIKPTAIPAVKILVPKSFGDSRGNFCEVYNRKRFVEHGITQDFVQDNQSWSAANGTVRGLHFQRPPMAQDKLVWVPHGRIFDVAVDLRRSSPTFGSWVGEELSAENGWQLLIPAGFAHGFCTLERDTHVFYKVTSYYSSQYDLGIAWDDPDLSIDWPVGQNEAILSDKDAKLPLFSSLPNYFG